MWGQKARREKGDVYMEQFKLDTPNSPEPDSAGKKDAPQEPDFSGGPNFGSPEDWDQPSDGWFSKYGSTVVLPIIAILVLAGGIYLYATQKSAPTTLEDIGQEQGEISLIGEELELIDEITEVIEEETEEQEPKIEEIIPAPKKTTGAIVETAVRGNGVTHLARRALKTYISDSPQVGTDLTNEHRIYIEDYLKDKTGSQFLEVGNEISFSKDLIQEAIDASKNLTENQLKNLEKYSTLVSW